jgi:hypothetical protein
MSFCRHIHMHKKQKKYLDSSPYLILTDPSKIDVFLLDVGSVGDDGIRVRGLLELHIPEKSLIAVVTKATVVTVTDGNISHVHAVHVNGREWWHTTMDTPVCLCA